MCGVQSLLDYNKQWAKEIISDDPMFFSNLALEQKPKYLWIGCSDSRVPANEIVGLNSGELFVHRNVANLCIHTDFSFLSVLEFAVNFLQVEHVIVCGHYNCGGVQAALENKEVGLVDNWLRNVRDVHAKHSEELLKLKSTEDQLCRLVELSVVEQVENVCHTTIVQKAWSSGKKLHVHGWVYDIKKGLINDLKVSKNRINQIDFRYRTVGKN